MIHHYFSKNPDKRAKFIFNLIAPVYNAIDKYLDEDFTIAINKLNNEINLKDMKVLDIGTGTGAWGSKFMKFDIKSISGVDFSENMIKVASKKHKNMNFSVANAENLNIFKNNTFDIITASYVLHGVKKDKRKIILTEMKRVSKEYVVIHDFYGKTPFATRVLEFLERSDYKFFKKNFETEMKEMFSDTRIVPLKGTALYIGRI